MTGGPEGGLPTMTRVGSPLTHIRTAKFSAGSDLGATSYHEVAGGSH